ncbi:YwiC-like family protein [Caldithrix abyssi]
MRTTFKHIAFPREHGSWALTFEPLILALTVGFSSAGLLLFFGAAFAFLAHQPARVLISDKERPPLAWTMFFAYGLVALVFAIFYLQQANLNQALPAIIAVGLMVLYLVAEYFDLHRALLTEMMGSVAMGLIALSIVLSAGWPWNKAWPFLLLLYLRSLSTTLYVHFRLKLDRKKQRSILWPQIWQILTLLIAIVLRFKQAIPFLAFLSVVILSVRGIYGLSPWRNPMTVKQIGLAEFFFGLIFIVFSGVGYLTWY